MVKVVEPETLCWIPEYENDFSGIVIQRIEGAVPIYLVKATDTVNCMCKGQLRTAFPGDLFHVMDFNLDQYLGWHIKSNVSASFSPVQ